jgi:hypothetical protein
MENTQEQSPGAHSGVQVRSDRRSNARTSIASHGLPEFKLINFTFEKQSPILTLRVYGGVRNALRKQEWT